MLRCKTQLLSEPETASYIVSRLKIAGSASGELFSPEASAAIHRFSRGTPRLVNLLCEHALISAYVDQKKIVDTPTIESVAKELELDSHAAAARPSVVPKQQSANEVAEILRQLEVLNERLDRLNVVRTGTKGGV